MKQDELQSIVSGLVEELRELPDHTELTTWQLMDRAGYMDEELSNEDLMDIDYALRQAARKAHITLDGSKHDGLVEGLPYNLDYIVENAKAQIRCPRCGSIDTARILYGLPAMDDELEERIRPGKSTSGDAASPRRKWMAKMCAPIQPAFAMPARRNSARLPFSTTRAQPRIVAGKLLPSGIWMVAISEAIRN